MIVLLDEEGVEHDFTLLEVVEVDGVPYALLLPVEFPEEGVVVLRIEKAMEKTCTWSLKMMRNLNG